MSEMKEHNNKPGVEIAIIGMSGKFPGAGNIDEFWNNLKNGVESISFFSDKELKESGLNPQLIDDHNYVNVKGGIIEDKEFFDASFFDYTPKEAEIMDPQMRLFHECAWEALENAGYDSESYNGLIGVYAGASSSAYWECLTFLSGKSAEQGQFTAGQLSNKDSITTRVAYTFNLKGPAVTVHTACSTSLVAVHMACQAILDGECDMVLAGGVSILSEDVSGYIYQEGMILSPDGHCRAFDARSKGTVGGNGVGIVVLKSLEGAIADGDYIHAVIKGTAINNDGNRKASYTAPSRAAQAEVIRIAHQVAEVEPENISYIETHGTGTSLGDPIEFEALTQAFNTNKRTFCAIGSLKTNIGHLDAAAGVAGLIKTVLVLKHKLIPPSLHYEKPNPKIDFHNSPFYVNAGLREWKNTVGLLKAGVSSFGIGGTNAHVVLEEAPVDFRCKSLPSPQEREYKLILLSAKTESALEKMTNRLVECFNSNPGVDIADAAYTLQVGRKAFKHRRMLVCSTLDEAIDALSSPGSGKAFEFAAKETNNRNIVFMFPGQGAQYVNMGLNLYRKESVFREEIDRCFDILNRLVDVDIKEILYPSGASHSHPLPDINQTEITQPVLFIFEYALARLLMNWGIEPYAMIGHSIGEYTAACLAGVFSLEDALTLVSLRGRLIGQMPPGAMLSLSLSEKDLNPLLAGWDERLSLAAVNGLVNCVVSGTHDTIAAFEKQMSASGYRCRLLHTSHAFHSYMMNPILKAFEEKIKQVALNKPGIPYISNVTGNWITVGEAKNPWYWASHLRSTVRFSDGLQRLLKEEGSLFVEVGPGKTLGTFVRQHQEGEKTQLVVNLIRHPKEEVADDQYLLNQIGQLWLYGVKIDWAAFHKDEKRYRIPLPTYPFERQPYWIRGDLLKMDPGILSQKPPGRKNVSDFFYIPLWKPTVSIINQESETFTKPRWLVFIDDCGIGVQLIKKLREEENEVITVKPGTEFSEISHQEFRINPRQPYDYQALIKKLCLTNMTPQYIVHLWSIDAANKGKLDFEKFEKAQYLGFYSLLFLVKAVEKQKIMDDFQVTVVSNNLHEVTGEEIVCPEKSTLLGPVKVIPQEYANIKCHSVDVVLPEPGSWREKKLTQQLLKEISMESADTIVSYRNNRRWIQTFEAVRLGSNSVDKGNLQLRKAGVYLITGGPGRIGFVLAEYLARSVGARLILVGRSTLPDRSEWDEWLSTHQDRDSVSQKIRKIQKIEALGSEVMVISADAASLEQMQEVVAGAEMRFGRIDGVIHAAGITRGKSAQCSIEQISNADCEQQFQPKVYGLLVLEEIFRDKELDFCLLTSSLASILGGLGFAAYSAANLFMDAFVKRMNRPHPRRWISVNWDGWRLVEEDQQHSSEGDAENLAITPQEGEKAFQRILNWGEENQVVVSTTDLQSRIDQWIKFESLRKDNRESEPEYPGLKKARPHLTTPYLAPRDQIEQIVANIWEEFFGFERIGINDNFFELGGDSLKAITVIAKLHKKLNVKLPLTEFFKSPNIKGISEVIRRVNKDNYVSIEMIEKKEYYPLSSAQRRLYVLYQMDKECVSYNMPLAMVWEGEIDNARLKNAFWKLIQRHESLRTSFLLVEGEPLQKIHETVDFEIEYYDLDNMQLTAGNSEEDIVKNFERPFDLSIAPLLRVGVLNVEERKFIFMADMHHIISDGVSQTLLTQDFATFYNGEELPALRLHYKDYSQWQNSEIEKEPIKKQEKYWLKQFEGEIPVLNMLTDYARPLNERFEGDFIKFEIEKELTKKLKQLTNETEATLYMVLLAVYNILLSKYTAQEDIVVGSGIAGRRHADLENIIGLFVNMLPMRNCPIKTKTFEEFLHEVKQNALNAYENQDYQFDELVKKLGLQRDWRRNPLFDTQFTFQNIEEETTEIAGLKLNPYDNKKRIMPFDLSLNGKETGETITMTMAYLVSLFKPQTIERMERHFIEILERVVENRDVKIEDIKVSHEMVIGQANISQDEYIAFEF